MEPQAADNSISKSQNQHPNQFQEINGNQASNRELNLDRLIQSILPSSLPNSQRSANQEPFGGLRDFVQRPPGNMVRETSGTNVYLEEFLNFQRPAYKPDGRSNDMTSWLTLRTEDLYRSVHQKEKSAEETADTYRENATRSLKKAIADAKLKFTTDGAEPKVFEYNDKFELKEKATAAEIARETLGANATKEQVDKFTTLIVSLNKLDDPDKELRAGQKIKLPGQTADGGISYRQQGRNVTEWYDESSIEFSERGQGQATYTDRNGGCDVVVMWDPEDKKNCKLGKFYDERIVETDATGTRTERVPPDGGLKSKVYQDAQGRRVSMDFNPKDSQLLKVSVQDWKAGTLIELEPDANGQLRGKKTDQSGDVITTMGGKLNDDRLTLFEEKKIGDKITRTYENGTVEEFVNERISKRTGKDDWGRFVEETFRPPGRVPPHQIHVTLNDNDDEAKRTRLTFTRTDFGEYWGETLKDGRVDTRHQLRPSGQIMHFKGQKVSSDLKDGTHIERSQVYDRRDPKKVAGYKVSQSRGGATYTVTADRDGNIQSDVYTYGGLDGRQVERTRSSNGRMFTAINMSERTGFKTELSYDSVSGMFTGKRRDGEGKVVEDVVLSDNKIIYTSPTGNRRIEVFDVRANDLLGKKPQTGMYDIQRGTETFPNDDESVSVKPVAPGRTDRVIDDYCQGQTIIGTTIRGERSLVTPAQVVVHNPDGSGVRLNHDLTVDRWGKADAENAMKESLTASEADYLKYLKGAEEHRNFPGQEIDMRDFIELHRQFATRPDGEATLSKFYSALKTLDTAKHLTTEERRALRINIMRDVAHPEEMDQSRSPTCNAEVIRRELAMNCPDQYVMTFFQAMNDGKVPIYTNAVDGVYGSNRDKPEGAVNVDPANLKLADCTGRNLAARIFDNICIQISAQPDYNWVATEDGVGKFIPVNPKDEPKEFTGMQMGDIADVLTKLTGLKRAVVQITSIDDLNTAFEANGKRSMITAVNASKSPFSWEPINFNFDELFTNHVVSLTNIFQEGGATYVNYMNQWGLEEDHSTASTAVRAERFLNNMTGVNSSWRGTRPVTPPQAITAGDPTKVYKIEGGRIVEDPRYCLKDGRVRER